MSTYTGADRRYTRSRLKVQVLKGLYLTEPIKMTQVAAPLDIVTPAGDAISGRVAIQSGMIVLLDESGYVGGIATSAANPGFRNCVATDATGAARPFVAYHDYDSHDVIQSGRLVGLDCGDSYELMLPWFDETVNYSRGDSLTFTAGGKLTKTTTAGDAVVMQVLTVGSNSNGSHPYVGKTPGASFTSMLHVVTAWTRVDVPA